MNGASISTVWAAFVVIIIPAIIIVAAEIDERLRQRRSELRPAVTIIRSWTVPSLAVWALLVPVLGVDATSGAVRVISTLLLISAAAAVLRVLRVFIEHVRTRPRGTGQRPVPQLLLALPRLGLFIVTGWILLNNVWGVDLSAALTALGVTSLVISFALQDTLSGLASGVLLLSDQPFQTGDWIRVGDLEGQVIDINWRTSRIRNRNGDTITVPNSELAGSSIVNFTSPDTLHRVVVNLQVAFVNPPTLAMDMLLDAARATPGVLGDPAPSVRVTQIDDPLMGYEVHLWIDDYKLAPRVEGDFGALVWYQSQRDGVPLPSPAQDLFVYDGPAAAASGQPTPGDVRQALQRSPLLQSLPDDDLDQLARDSQLARYSAGELLSDSRVTRPRVVLLIAGRAQLVLLDAATGGQSADVVVASVGEGEIIDVLDSTGTAQLAVGVRSVTDCEVVIIDPDLIGRFGSRHAELADAFNRTSAVRRRRIERTAERFVVAADGAEESDDA
ncbi:MAG: mechanosensitive ion channel [Actinomycetia bacterium]|nr:mechanosensitive ion channel [Actinomycetes bacterium]